MRTATWLLCVLLASPSALAASRRHGKKPRPASAKRHFVDPFADAPKRSAPSEPPPEAEAEAAEAPVAKQRAPSRARSLAREPADDAPPEAPERRAEQAEEDPFLSASSRSAETFRATRLRAPAPEQEEPAGKVSEGYSRRKRRAKQPTLRLLAGGELLTHSLAFAAAEGTGLRSYRAGFVVAPWFRVEGFPFALFSRGALSDLGVSIEHAFAAGLKTRYGPSSVFPVSLSRTDVGLKYRMAVGEALRLAPSAGFRMRDFSAGPSEDGQTLEGLPSVTYQAARVGVEAELPVSALTVFVRANVLYAFSVGAAAEAPFGARTGALGLDGAAGLSVAFSSYVDLLAQVQLSRFGLTLRPEGAVADVSGADLSLGGAVALRASF